MIDEAQCCSDEGRRDRSDYEQLSKLKQLYPKIPIVAFTDIGSKTVFNDIVELLQLEEPTLVQLAEPEKTVFFSAPLYKPNLRYSVRSKPTQEKTLARYMAETIEEFYPGSTGITYCSSKSKVESFYRYIQAYLLQGTVGMYHAGMSDGAKEKLSNKWKQGDIECMVATKSFASECLGLALHAPCCVVLFRSFVNVLTSVSAPVGIDVPHGE